ncbi:MAG: EAL domain-containing protein [Lachnospiraceae bacterium]|nr:EAL domain-containing protein [Lachnospiraceae bacterium]
MSERIDKKEWPGYLCRSLDAMPGGILVYRADASEEILYVNQHALEIFECETKEDFFALTGGSFCGMVYRDDLDETERSIKDQIRSGNDHFDHVTYRIQTKSGRIRTVEDYGSLVRDPEEGDLYYVFFQDARIKYLSHDIDPVTRLPGMRRFLEYSARNLRMNMDNPSAPHSVFLFFNILNFKLFNVQYGIEEGDRLLLEYAGVLRDIFTNTYVSRFSDDHFVVMTDDARLLENLSECSRQLGAIRPEAKLSSKVGIFQVQDLTMDPAMACEFARMAASSIRNRPDTFFAFYTESLRSRMNLQEYVKNHIDEACEKGYIQVYYQPVIRTITGNLCGMEALSRWIDPERGFLSPGDFISALEESHQIQKLDSYVVREICRNFSVKLKEGVPIIPVSFNLSRLDFLLCDIFQVVEDAVREYDIPRDMIHIEITESLFVQETARISQEIDRFHEAGYQVWMDDFGSGYSSLNVLKDYQFDELKIDMVFLSNFNQKSKDIITSIVSMSKKVGIQTLAEGVETEEQYEFLKSIGCEKVQGYYFGKPRPYEESIRHCVEQGLYVENRTWRQYYDRVGQVDLVTDLPLALMERRPKDTKFLFLNETYQDILYGVEIRDVHELACMIDDDESSIGRVYRSFFDRVIRSGEEEEFTYPVHGQYLRLTATKIAECEGHNMLCLHVDNISKNANRQQQERMDNLLRNIYYMYDDILLVNISGDYSEGVMAEDGFYFQNRKYNLKQQKEEFARSYVYPEDRARLQEFLNPATLMERFAKANGSPLYAAFRMKQENGDYRWVIHSLIRASTDQEKRYLHCIQKAQFMKDNYNGDYGQARHVESVELSDKTLWESLVSHSPICYFWKDRERRFVGVNQSFLDYYGLTDASEVIGKTDEDMRWHVSDGPYFNDEIAVLEEGRSIIDSPGKCVIRGVVHDIFATKIPVYDNGRIAGLLGYFVDAKRYRSRDGIDEKAAVLDPITGVAAVRTVIEHLVGYMEDYQLNRNDFVFLMIEVPEYERAVSTYGKKVGDSLLRKIAEKLTNTVSTAGTVGRVRGANFSVVYRYEKQEEVEDLCYSIGEEIKGIHEVEGRPCTLFARIGEVYGREVKDLEEMARLANKRKRMY